MNGPSSLDTFETALLGELRREVTEHPAAAAPAARVPRPRGRLRLGAAGAAGIAASVVAVFGLGGTGGSPAYAVAENSAGDVTVTVHRLDDAAGLEKALRAKGIDADVSYDADSSDSTAMLGSVGPGGAVPPDGAQTHTDEQGSGSGSFTQRQGEKGPSLSGPGSSPGGADDPCGPLDPAPARLSHPGDDWVLSIPAGSPLQDRHVVIGTGADGSLSVTFAGSVPGSYCGLMSREAPGTR
jgi:hypothetical protein